MESVKRATKSSRSSTTLRWLTVLWLVMQVFVPAYHQHTDAFCPSDAAYAQWKGLGHGEHDCYICSLHYSPCLLEGQAFGVPIPEDTDAPCSWDTLLCPVRVLCIPSVRAPPAG